MNTIQAFKLEKGDLFQFSYEPHLIFELVGEQYLTDGSLINLLVRPVLKKIRCDPETPESPYVWKTQRLVPEGEIRNLNPYCSVVRV